MTMIVVLDNSSAEILSQSFMPRFDVSETLNLCQTPVDATSIVFFFCFFYQLLQTRRTYKLTELTELILDESFLNT